MRRRDAIKILGGLAGTTVLPAAAQAVSRHSRPIPVTGQRLPVIGMGTWLTFDVSGLLNLRAPLKDVMAAFLANGGAMVDSSPMYGNAEDTIGALTRTLNVPVAGNPAFFSATKVWTIGKTAGIAQMERSKALWGVPAFDLMQIHNMLDWRTHLATLKEWKAAGRIRYIGITTSHGRRHDDLAAALKAERFDFVQFTYNLADRSVEPALLPLAAERGAAVIINRPLDGGDLFGSVKGKALPPWSAEIGCANWAQYFLKWIVSHPAVTCAIPATSQAVHMAQNMGAGIGPLPDAAMRARMAKHFESL